MNRFINFLLGKKTEPSFEQVCTEVWEEAKLDYLEHALKAEYHTAMRDMLERRVNRMSSTINGYPHNQDRT